VCKTKSSRSDTAKQCGAKRVTSSTCSPGCGWWLDAAALQCRWARTAVGRAATPAPMGRDRCHIHVSAYLVEAPLLRSGRHGCTSPGAKRIAPGSRRLSCLPHGMHCFPGCVEALEAVATKAVPLRLDALGRAQERRTETVVVGQRCAQGGYGDGIAQREKHETAPAGCARAHLGRHCGIEEQIRQRWLLRERLGNEVQHFRSDDATALPDGCELSETQIPVVRLRRCAQVG